MSGNSKLRADQHYLPIRVNEPTMVIFWDVDEVRPIVISFAIGVPFDAINYTVILGLISFFIAGKLKSKFAKGYIAHLGWWCGVIPMKTSCSMPDPLIRELFR